MMKLGVRAYAREAAARGNQVAADWDVAQPSDIREKITEMRRHAATSGKTPWQLLTGSNKWLRDLYIDNVYIKVK